VKNQIIVKLCQKFSRWMSY